jgi:hypothetical protein
MGFPWKFVKSKDNVDRETATPVAPSGGDSEEIIDPLLTSGGGGTVVKEKVVAFESLPSVTLAVQE